jgi:hypothetical protein
MILPPKRFESPEDPKFDQIRHKYWFYQLKERRKKTSILEAALVEMKKEGLSQKKASELYSVDPRELRDYERFVMKESPSYKDANTKKTIQAIISIAYQGYSHDQAAQPFTKYVKNVAIKFGVNPRHAIEAWEIDQNLYPAGYK